MLKRYTNYGVSMNYFVSSRNNLAYILKWESVMQMHAITKSTNLHVYSCFPTWI